MNEREELWLLPLLSLAESQLALNRSGEPLRGRTGDGGGTAGVTEKGAADFHAAGALALSAGRASARNRRATQARGRPCPPPSAMSRSRRHASLQ